MNKRILKRYSLGFLCLMGSLVGCYSEQPTNDSTHPIGKPVEVRLQVNAPLGSTAIASESAIKRLRMVVFSSEGNSDAGKLILNKYYPTVPPSNILEETITSGRRDIYLIANEPLGGDGEELDGYKKIATVADMRKLSLAYQAPTSVGSYTPPEIPMFVEHLNEQLEVDATSTIGGTVERTMAKVTLKLNVKNDNFPTGKQVVIDHIIIKNLPKSSFLIPQNYTGELVASEKQAVGVVAVASGYDRSTTNTFYVPEYLFDKLDKGAYIEITGHVNGDLSRVAKYSVKLGDAMGGEPYSDYHITRNRHYTFTGDVKSYGEMDGVAVKVTVAPWDTVEMSEEVGHYIAFDKTTDGANNTIAEESNLSDMGTTINVLCNTNTGGWYTVTKDEKDVIVDRSNPTPSASGATSQTVSITIPKIGELPYLQSYTVSIYHPTIAKESVGSVKALRFTQYGGFIPNSVLKNAGWPTNNLPPHGLQLAKRGDKVLPSGVAGSDDPFKQWKISNTLTGGTAWDLGMGAISTDAMKGAEHPAAQYCREMGEGWFLPSAEELKLIYTHHSSLGASYLFPTRIYYWSATENNDIHSYDVRLFDLHISSNRKIADTSPSRVRCVKAI